MILRSDRVHIFPVIRVGAAEVRRHRALEHALLVSWS